LEYQGGLILHSIVANCRHFGKDKRHENRQGTTEPAQQAKATHLLLSSRQWEFTLLRQQSSPLEKSVFQ